MNKPIRAPKKSFVLEEATIDELHAAIKAGETTCVDVVRHYLARVHAFNGTSNLLVTKDGAPVPEARGTVRGGAPLKFPTQTVKASEVLPDLDKYRGPPLEFGRMEATASDPSAQQQFGLTVGQPSVGQVNALATLNIRGERSVTCRGDFDLHPSKGALPKGAPPVCEYFRHLPDALERAAELDAAYGRNPDLEKMPMYAVVFSFKDPFDTKDMRSTGGGDAHYDIDFPARDHVLVEQLRNKGAIIFAKAVNTEYNGRPDDPGGPHKPDKVLTSTLGYQRSTWAGNPSNPYDTTRAASLGSSSGSGVSVSTNMVMCSLGEETRASCRGPANHNSVALILPHKALLGFDGGAIGADIHVDRSGILARTIGDAAKVLDALKDPAHGYYDPRDPFTTVPRSSVLDSYARHTRPAESLKGLRIGVIRESMTVRPGNLTEVPITTAAAQEIKSVLGGKLGATLVESSDPLCKRDPDIEQMAVDYRVALGAAGAGLHARYPVPADRRRTARVQGIRSRNPADRVRAGKSLWLRQDEADRLHARHGRRPHSAAFESRSRHGPASGAADGVPFPHQSVPVAPRRRLESQRLHRNAHRFHRTQQSLEILGRRPARKLAELGRSRRSAQPARRAAEHHRAHHAARAFAPRRHDGDAGKPARCAGAGFTRPGRPAKSAEPGRGSATTLRWSR